MHKFVLIYDKQDTFNFEIVNFQFLDGDVPHHLPMVYTFSELFVLLAYSLMLVSSTIETNL